MASPRAFLMDVDGEEVPCVLAMREHQRGCAANYFLYHFRQVGPEIAAERTCARFGHEARGGQCDRCGLGLAEMRVRGELRGRHR